MKEIADCFFQGLIGQDIDKPLHQDMQMQLLVRGNGKTQRQDKR